MTAASATASQPDGDDVATDDLTARIFRSLYPEFDLHAISGTYVVVPKGVQWFAGHSSATSPARSATIRAEHRYHLISRIIHHALIRLASPTPDGTWSAGIVADMGTATVPGAQFSAACFL